MLRRPTALLATAALLATSACSTDGDGPGRSTDALTGNMATAATASAPARSSRFTGQLVVEPARSGRACLLLTTADETYVLRSADPRLEAVAWQTDGSFDSTRSGVARDGRLVAPYGDERTTVRGAVSTSPDAVCGSHPSLFFVGAGRAPDSAPSATTTQSPSAPASAAPAPPSVDLDPDLPLVTKSGRLTVVRGNQGEGYCLAIETPEGLYTVTSTGQKYDATVSTEDDRIIERETGLHLHGRNSLGMAASYGQQVTLRGYLDDVTDAECSRYFSLGVVEVTRP